MLWASPIKKKIKKAKEEMKKVLDFIEDNKDEFITTVFHKDGDGLFSFAIFSNYLEEKGISLDDYIPITNKEIIEGKYPDSGLLIFLDCAPLKRKGDEKIAIIEHHEEKSKWAGDSSVWFNKIFGIPGSCSFFLSLSLPKKFRPEVYVVAALCDGAYVELLGYLKEVLKEDYERLCRRGLPNTYLSLFGDYVARFTYKEDKKRIEICREFVKEGSTVIEKYWNDISTDSIDDLKTLGEIIQSFKNVKVYGNKLAIAQIPKGTHRLGHSWFALAYDVDIHLIAIDYGKDFKVSLRSKRINLIGLLDKISKRIGFEWGGFPKAAGAIIDKDKFKLFLNSLLAELGWKK